MIHHHLVHYNTENFIEQFIHHDRPSVYRIGDFEYINKLIFCVSRGYLMTTTPDDYEKFIKGLEYYPSIQITKVGQAKIDGWRTFGFLWNRVYKKQICHLLNLRY